MRRVMGLLLQYRIALLQSSSTHSATHFRPTLSLDARFVGETSGLLVVSQFPGMVQGARFCGFTVRVYREGDEMKEKES